MSENSIKIDVVSDVACPWCYVGKRRLEEALIQWKGTPIEVTWHPFQLDPSMRAEGMNRDTYLTSKFGSVDRVGEMTDRLTEVGKTVGIDFDFGDNWLAVNTLKLHQLLHVAREEGFGAELKERFLSAYFQETQHLNKLEALYAIADDFGWSNEKVDAIINDQEIADKVTAEMLHYQQRGVSGVPFFVINDKYGINGAQPFEAFLEAFQTVAAES
ncbi:MAG: DsbA family oxidoreductase [Bacteroidetes bacterium]|jgi:predicted DsbA family dithiol-disulfide isomerase|nr:DsbA family oxidoreductase [Bacteroidota bacterium]